MNKLSLITFFTVLLILGKQELNAQIVNIPDSIFKASLVYNSSINTNGDTEIQVSEAQTFTGQMLVASRGVFDLTGIEAFTSISYLDCRNNQLTTLDVSGCTALSFLRCGRNQLTTLDVSGNANLYQLECEDNQLTTLNVSACTTLNWLECRNNNLMTLDLSANTALTLLECSENQLTTLDVSTCSILEHCWCPENQLTSLNVKNGNNINIISIEANSNPNLSCVEVDSPLYSIANWTNGFDSTASFSLDCNTSITKVSGETIGLNFYPNPTSRNLTIELDQTYNNTSIEVTNLIGQLVYSNRYHLVRRIDLELEDVKGVYFIKIKTEKGEATIKILKE
jgi:hypothetical protein